MQQSTFHTLLASKLREARLEQNQGTLILMQQSTFDTLLAMQLQFIEDADILAANQVALMMATGGGTTMATGGMTTGGMMTARAV